MATQRARAPTSRQSKATADLLEALGSSLDIRVVLDRAYPLLLELVPADYGALGVSSSGRPEDYEWIVARMPTAFFAAYPQMAGHDFVRRSVQRQPNVALRDEDMIARADLEKSVFYQHAREVGVTLEHVMAVMLHVDDRWQSGLSLFRENRRPFSERERSALQRVTPAIAQAVRNCHTFEAAADWAAGLENMFHRRGSCAILVAPPANEVARTPGVTALLEKWFAPHERPVGRLPDPLVALLARASSPFAGDDARRLTRSRDDAALQITFFALEGRTGRARAMLVLDEIATAVAVPAAWRARLTSRELEVTAGVLRGWDNRLIASEIHCLEGTVKKHLQHIFDKLGVKSRTALVAQAGAFQPALESPVTSSSPRL
jgi:DNA-binding CsgD family transcriptional regulator